MKKTSNKQRKNLFKIITLESEKLKRLGFSSSDILAIMYIRWEDTIEMKGFGKQVGKKIFITNVKRQRKNQKK